MVKTETTTTTTVTSDATGAVIENQASVVRLQGTIQLIDLSGSMPNVTRWIIGGGDTLDFTSVDELCEFIKNKQNGNLAGPANENN